MPPPATSSERVGEIVFGVLFFMWGSLVALNFCNIAGIFANSWLTKKDPVSQSPWLYRLIGVALAIFGMTVAIHSAIT